LSCTFSLWEFFLLFIAGFLVAPVDSGQESLVEEDAEQAEQLEGRFAAEIGSEQLVQASHPRDEGIVVEVWPRFAGQCQFEVPDVEVGEAVREGRHRNSQGAEEVHDVLLLGIEDSGQESWRQHTGGGADGNVMRSLFVCPTHV